MDESFDDGAPPMVVAILEKTDHAPGLAELLI